MKRFLLPLILFAGLSAVLAASLSNDPRRLPSTFIGKQA
ncbi:MAG: cytochrome c biosis protein CcmG, thiol:disulfide interchange protein DsbE, partial [Caballeronia sp.]|nr:cytochrome c biosis protein CcmG, thiol:disulfide interchange protein DsbE [Caballeronia sp.]